MSLKMLGSIVLGDFLLKIKAIPKDAISYYLLVQLLEQCTRNYGQALVLLFLFKLSEDFRHIADC